MNNLTDVPDAAVYELNCKRYEPEYGEQLGLVPAVVVVHEPEPANVDVDQLPSPDSNPSLKTVFINTSVDTAFPVTDSVKNVPVVPEIFVPVNVENTPPVPEIFVPVNVENTPLTPDMFVPVIETNVPFVMPSDVNAPLENVEFVPVTVVTVNVANEADGLNG